MSIGMQGKLPKGRIEGKVQEGKLVRNK
jgi:hypothetical protein